VTIPPAQYRHVVHTSPPQDHDPASPRLELVLLGHSKRNSEEDNNAVGDLYGMEEADPGMDEATKKYRWGQLYIQFSRGSSSTNKPKLILTSEGFTIFH
jgi:hypothetical protein